MTAPEHSFSRTRQLRLQSFSHLLDLDAIEFPPPGPRQVTFQDEGLSWTDLPLYTQISLTRWAATGYILHIPGHTEPLFFRDAERAARAHRYLCSHLLAASYLAEFEGDLYDWRSVAPATEQHGRLLRRNYRRLHTQITNGQDLRATLRAIPAEPNRASLYFETLDSCLCPDCVRNNLAEATWALRYGEPEGGADFWRITVLATHWEDRRGDALTCDSCDRIIEPVFGEA